MRTSPGLEPWHCTNKAIVIMVQESVRKEEQRGSLEHYCLFTLRVYLLTRELQRYCLRTMCEATKYRLQINSLLV